MRSVSDRSAVVIGGGIAGCATSQALAQSAWKVHLVDCNPRVAGDASGTAQAVLHPRLSGQMSVAHEIALLGYQFTTRSLDALHLSTPSWWNRCGTLQLDHASRRQLPQDVRHSLALPIDLATRIDRTQASDIAGVPIASGGLYFPRGGWIEGPALCAHLLAHDNISASWNFSVCKIEWSALERLWTVWSNDGSSKRAGIVVFANGFDAMHFPTCTFLGLRRVRGQISRLPVSAQSATLATVLCGEGVITPAHNALHCVGATYVHEGQDTQLSVAEHRSNHEMLRRLAPSLCPSSPSAFSDGWVGFRCTSRDRVPIAGPMDQIEGLYLNVAHGSRGFSTAPLLGQLIADLASATPPPLSTELINACSPHRFAYSSVR